MIVLNKFGRRNELLHLLRDRGSKFGVEIGTDRGEYAQQLLGGIPELSLVCIDPYMAYTEGNQVHSQEEVEVIYDEAYQRLFDFGHRVELRRATSMQGLKDFQDNSLDFVFIDGNHDYQHVYEDITEWSKKVRPGGVVCGHDYEEDKANNYGVIKAVDQYVKENRINPFFVMKKGTLANCWMFIKS